MYSTHFHKPRKGASGFSLVELLVVICVVVILGSLSSQAISAVLGSSSTNKNASDFSQILTLARAYAMANNTYVRVAMSQMLAGGKFSTQSIVVLCFYSSDGTNGANEATNPWAQLNRPLILNNLTFNDALKGATPDTTNDVLPDASTITAMTVPVPGISATPLVFTSFVQFNPIGESSIAPSGTSSHIKIGCVGATDKAGKNPFILRLSGVNGTVTILRKENME